MHPNPAFHAETADRILAFARDCGFGVLTVNGDAGPLAAHVPFLPAADGIEAAPIGQETAHLARLMRGVES